MPNKICKHCEKQFKSRSTKRQFCSHRCYSNSNKGVRRTNFDAKGPRNGRWNGGKRKDKDGYVLIHAPYHPFCEAQGYVREHRLVMERQIKRFLFDYEVVHHINGIKADNTIENLQLMTKKQHDQLKKKGELQ